MPKVVRFISAVLFACATLLGAPAAFAVDSGDIVVVSSKGEVHITRDGAERNVRAGGVLELPASVRTGRDGNIELKQGATTVSVGPETLLEFPALEKRGAPIDRIVQPRGNAFYNIGKREGRKLRVETPYLVGVIKGTQFNVAAEGEATTISLFEGLLEVRATDDSDVVDLKAGEIASRRRGDKSISIMKMDTGKAPPTGSRPAGGESGNGAPGPDAPRAAPPVEGGDSVLADRGTINPRADVGAGVSLGGAPDATPTVDVAAGTALAVGNSVDVVANAAANLGPTGADVVTTLGVAAGPATVDLGVGAAVDVAAGTVDVSTNTAVGVGPVTADLGTSSSVDLGAGTVDTSTSASIVAGPLTTDVAAGAAVDLGSGTVDTGVVVGASAPLVEVNVGTDLAADVVAGTVNLGLGVDVGVAGTDIDLAPVTAPVIETVTDTVVDVGGLLDGLLRRPGRK